MRRISHDLLVGPAITAEDLPRLRRAGVTGILSLQQPGVDILEDAVARIRVACATPPGVAWRNVAIRDYDPHDLIRQVPAAVASLRALLAEKRVVYVHCCEGVNRAPSIALAYLVLERGIGIEAALEQLLAAHGGARPYAEFLTWVRSPGRADP